MFVRRTRIHVRQVGAALEMRCRPVCFSCGSEVRVQGTVHLYGYAGQARVRCVPEVDAMDIKVGTRLSAAAGAWSLEPKSVEV